jgi:putative ABC transport system permease protein
MTAPVGTNRKMFWRIIRRLLFAHRGRLFVILLALGTGAAVTAALLNLQVDAKRRLTSEFRAFGPNVIITPRGDNDAAAQARTMPDAVLEKVPRLNEGNQVVRIGWLYLIASAVPHVAKTNALGAGVPVVVAGYTGGAQQEMLNSSPAVARQLTDGLPYCDLGVKAASTLNVHERDKLTLRNGSVEEVCSVWYVLPYGGQQDNQIFVHLETAQRLAQLPGKISLVEVVATGTPQSIERFIGDLQQRLPGTEVRPVRQFTEGEAKIYDRIRGVLTATVAIVLLLTGLCVMAAMTNVAMERRNDVGLMKAIGGASRRVLRLFLVEAALLGLTGGLFGAAAGIALSIGLGKAVFGVAALPRLIVYPVAVVLTVIVAIAGAFPLRRLTSIRPASVFRGEA